MIIVFQINIVKIRVRKTLCPPPPLRMSVRIKTNKIINKETPLYYIIKLKKKNYIHLNIKK